MAPFHGSTPRFPGRGSPRTRRPPSFWYVLFAVAVVIPILPGRVPFPIPSGGFRSTAYHPVIRRVDHSKVAAIVRLEWTFATNNLVVDAAKLDSLHIAHYARYGNHFWQAVRALGYAQIFSVTDLYIDKNFLMIQDNLTCPGGIRFQVAPRGSYPNRLIGNFIRSPPGFPRLDFSLISPCKREYQRRLFPQVQAVPGSLMIHIRAGDIFTEPAPRPEYVQPPIGYYTDIMRRKNWSVIVLVAQDYSNPCVAAVEQAGASYVRRPLYEDLEVLFGAEHLIIGRGTFGVAVAMLSIHVKVFYTFNISSSACGGHYNCWPDRAYWRGIMQGWDHTPEELALMLKHGCEKWTWIQPGTDDFGEMHPHME
jgi:hypothetical protein